MTKVLVDTNILIDFSKSYTEKLTSLLLLQEQGEVELVVNSVVVAEYFTDKNIKTTKHENLAKDFLSNFGSIDMDKKIGEIAGKILREKKVFALGDALIAATCLVNNCLLATNNQKDFQKIKGLEL